VEEYCGVELSGGENVIQSFHLFCIILREISHALEYCCRMLYHDPGIFKIKELMTKQFCNRTLEVSLCCHRYHGRIPLQVFVVVPMDLRERYCHYR
jgi:hypothetical protein